ncbi:2'-5' RNA ligase family protein [Rhodococcus sp. IEGM 1381]|uniref:2'-5' RNA ligase family protein n=1 Tax=Rhodococcus sp. IEGM 1381 TaxID=3047085 RepID=UPI0024B67F24|nr:2'-5' RNA ligase family protein [Rhodococcus sp. IEGM 1381]MDI9896718.1 2'-5' RNA ligase family protein [Rhodococcus sp. IEGM 1381]
MVQSAELLLDSGLDAAVRREWAALSDAGLPSQNRHRGESNRPHITVAVAASMPVAVDDGAAVRFDPFDVLLGGLVVFGGRTITLARLVVPTSELLDLHARMHEAVGEDSLDHLDLGRWTPHVTLARRLTSEEAGSAVRLLSTSIEDLVGSAVALRRWDGEAKREWRIG